MTPSKPAPPKPAGPGPKPNPPSGPAPSPTGPGRGNGHALPPIGDTLPALTDLIRELRDIAEQFINTAGRPYDPATASGVEAYPGELYVDVRLAMFRSDVVEVRRGLAELAAWHRPSVMFTDPPGTPTPPGEEAWTPGLAAVPDDAACESPDGGRLTTAGAGESSGPRPRRADSEPTGNGVQAGGRSTW